MKAFLALFFTAFLALAARGLAQTLPDAQIAQVDFEQKLGAALPIEAVFRDEQGAPVRLGQFFGQKPVVLALVYYECPNLCTVVLNGMLESLRNVRLDVGRDFDVVVVSINPADSPKLAAGKKHTYSMRYGRPGTAKGWHFLTGSAPAIRELADAVGFRYVYEPRSRQFAHPSGIVVATPEGKVAQYFLGIEYPPDGVRLALQRASERKLGTLTQRLLLLCFHYDPHTGRYSLVITRLMQVLGIGTVLLLGGTIGRMLLRERRKEVLP